MVLSSFSALGVVAAVVMVPVVLLALNPANWTPAAQFD